MVATLDLDLPLGAATEGHWTIYDPDRDAYWAWGRWARDPCAAERFLTFTEGARVARSLKARGRAGERTLTQETIQGRLF